MDMKLPYNFAPLVQEPRKFHALPGQMIASVRIAEKNHDIRCGFHVARRFDGMGIRVSPDLQLRIHGGDFTGKLIEKIKKQSEETDGESSMPVVPSETEETTMIEER